MRPGGAGFELLLGRLSAAFVGVTADQVDREIERWMHELVVALDIDRSSVWEFDPTGRSFFVTHSWAREGVRPTSIGLNVTAARPWACRHLLAGEMVVVSRYAGLPAEADDDIEYLGPAGAKSSVVVPMSVGGVIVGGVSFGTVFHEREWSADIVQRLRLVADVFGNALERKRAGGEIYALREDLRRVSSIALLGELTASIAHELSQPHTAIRTNAQAARRLIDKPEPDLGALRDIVEDIIEDNARMFEVIHNVRALFLKGQAAPAPLDLRPTLHQVARLLRHDAHMRNVSLTLDLPASLPLVTGEASQLTQVLVNLILNAFDAVCARESGPREVAVTVSLSGDGWVHVAVADSGGGIDPRVASRLFDAFVTTKSGGMGMGLAIARSIVDKHGGRLWVAQNTARGATLEFTLPAQASVTVP
jgi:signal transduction histidine kinase